MDNKEAISNSTDHCADKEKPPSIIIHVTKNWPDKSNCSMTGVFNFYLTVAHDKNLENPVDWKNWITRVGSLFEYTCLHFYDTITVHDRF